MMKRYVYENNVKLIKSLYDSEFWQILREDLKYYHQNNKYKRDSSLSKLNSLIEAIYVDSDRIDKALVAEMKDFYNETQKAQYSNNQYFLSINNQNCSLDGLVGWKQLFKF
ncbi:hypothetical protein HMPREF3215_00764 [Staphylococcus simulans]|nr:hypothetical protein HMPREF3215_00764 [Staphylococcus simulans]